MALLKVYSGSSWVTACAKTYNGTAWETLMKFFDGAAWQKLCGPVVSPDATGDYRHRPNQTCYAGAQFNSSGEEYSYTKTGGTTSDGPWLDSGASSEVWVERIVTSGSWNSLDPGTGRHQLSTTRSFRVSQSFQGSRIVTGYFKFWDAASGGSLLVQTSSQTWEAEQGTA